MARQKKSLQVPKKMRAKFEEISTMVDKTCREHLDEEYAELAKHALAALARKRPSPLSSGQPRSWAAGVLYALGQINFLSDDSFEPFLRLADLAKVCGVSQGNASQKAKLVREQLDMYPYCPDWTLESLEAKSPLNTLYELMEQFVPAQFLLLDPDDEEVDEEEALPASVVLLHPREPVPKGAACGLCGKKKRLTRTECCNQWICDDADEYVPFSYARNSCYRNHDSYTLCSFHDREEHPGEWQTCKTCRDDFETEIYVWYGTNDYNYVRLENPPKFKPTPCGQCGRPISLVNDGYSFGPGGYTCMKCARR